MWLGARLAERTAPTANERLCAGSVFWKCRKVASQPRLFIQVRQHERFFQRNTVFLCKVDHRRRLGANAWAPFGKQLGFPTKSQCPGRNAATSVRVLYDGVGPPTILRAVRAVHVDAVQRVLRSGFWPHVDHKDVVVSPSTTYGNASTAIVAV